MEVMILMFDITQILNEMLNESGTDSATFDLDYKVF
ncbi:hypothetical protein JOD17_001326 [Geomicrobium sediminis]|uniref:Uncharacterized protein n=1 Tax=Geomicrobium sediminis TaxID=1347788 RepID=A0ABS2PBK3_9BACL|nr:hypothetical protein [Geomicrobium sediminis]